MRSVTSKRECEGLSDYNAAGDRPRGVVKEERETESKRGGIEWSLVERNSGRMVDDKAVSCGVLWLSKRGKLKRNEQAIKSKRI